MSSQSAPLVSLPLHRLLSVHVREHIPNDPTRTKEPEDLLGLSHSDPDALIVTLSHCVTTRTVVGVNLEAVYKCDMLFRSQ